MNYLIRLLYWMKYKKKYKNIFDMSKDIKVLICSHCFFDNPHPYEKSSFPDYYEWLKFLCELSKKTNYSWRIKVHNDCLPGTIETIQEIIKKQIVRLNYCQEILPILKF